MPNTYSSSTDSAVYNDDFVASAGYHKILFNSGRSLQARELNQLQTILQQEITRLGRNIFKEGAQVRAGLLEIDNNYQFVRATGTGVTDLEVNTLLTGQTSGVTARVIEVVELGANDARIYIRYVGSNGATPGATETTFDLGEGLNSGAYTVGSNASDIGAGVKVFVDSGDFFVTGRFVFAPKQGLIVSPTSRNYTGTIGFQIVQDVVTVNDTTALYDNSGDLPNVAAPGADRHRIQLTLVDKSTLTSDDSFVFLSRIINSKVVEQVDELDNYNIIEDLLAERTYEESGNYLAEPFQLTFEDDDSTDSDIFAVVGPGVAYVRGYRVENQYPLKLKTPRPQAFENVPDDFVKVDYGAYVLADTADYANFATGDGEAFVNLSASATNPASAPVATAYVKGVARQDDNTLRVYLSNIEATSSTADFGTVQSLGTSTSNFVSVIKPAGGGSVIYESNKANSLYPLPRTRPSNLTDYEITFQESYEVTISGGSGSVSGQLGAGEAYISETSWVVTNGSGAIRPNSILTNNGNNFTVSDGSVNDTYHIVTKVSRNNAQRKTKVLQTGTTTGTLSSGVLELTDYDILDIVAVKQTNSGGADLSSVFSLDNGQRDDHYDKGRIILNKGATVSGTVYVEYRYFDHQNEEIADGGTGLFFDFGSYIGIDYTQIPDHRFKDGTVVSLRDYVDFRGKKDRTGSNTFIDARNPAEGSNIQLNASYYFSRADKLIATEDGEFQILMGQQAQDPQFKKTPDNALELYKIVMNPNTLSPSDISTTFIEHKRYTMADIAKLERKLDKLEELYSMSFAELEAKINPSLDSATGEAKLETGLNIDDFTDQTGADTITDDYNASIDPENHVLRPGFEGDNLRLVYRPDDGVTISPGNKNTSKNVSRQGDNVYIDYTTSSWISQPLATQSIAVNGNTKVDYIGEMELSPSSDEWKSAAPGTSAIAGSTRLDRKEGLLFNSWQWNWGGRSIEDTEVDPFPETFGRKKLSRRSIFGTRRNQSQRARRRLTGSPGHVNRVVSSETIRNIDNRGRAVDVAIIPWIRSRKIYFRATGLKPNTKFIPFFDGVNVSAWCKQESFVRFSTRTDDIGNQGSQYTTGHPDTASDLTSDAYGKVEGSFYIPSIRESFSVTGQGLPNIVNNIPFRFKTGKREFKLMDVNVPDNNQAGSYASAIYNAEGLIRPRKEGMTTTREPNKIKLGRNKIRNAFNPTEIRNYLNNVSPGDVNLIEPHISGVWGGDFSGDVNPADVAEGATIISDYISIDQNSRAGTSILPERDISFPFAQTFTVDNQFGVVITSIDLYFEESDTNNIPITAQIQTMRGGKPSGQVVPGSTVTLQSVTASADATTATAFSLEEPVYLDPGREYAIVVKTQSPDYKIWIARTGDYAVNSTNKVVSTQSSNGKLFLPQNGIAGLSKELDLAFVMNRAVFETNASLVLRNVECPAKLLDENPIVLKNGVTYAYVRHSCHGLDVGETATIQGVPAGSYGNLDETDLNGTHTVLAIDAKGYTFAVADPGANIFVGGNDVLSARNIQFTSCNPQIETVVPNKCSIDVSARFTTGKSIEGSETKFTKESTYSRIVPDQNQEFDAPRLVAQRSEETDNSGSIFASSGYSMDVKIDLKSGNDYVSPIVDLQRCSMTLVQNCIDPVDATYVDPVDETEPYGASGPSRHITTPIETVEPSRELEVTCDINVPEVADCEFYVRTALTGVNLFDQPWVPLGPQVPIIKNNDPSAIDQVKLTTNNLPPFTQSQIKTVFKSASMAKVPQVYKIQQKTFLGL